MKLGWITLTGDNDRIAYVRKEAVDAVEDWGASGVKIITRGSAVIAASDAAADVMKRL